MAMNSKLIGVESHPSALRARLVRSLRWFRNVYGWERIATLIVSPTLDEPFVAKNATGFFSGNMSSFIDRRMYLFGSYEELHLNAFFAFMQDKRRGNILDVGANVGTHSLAFAQHFKQVHAFEPNPALWPCFTRNMILNGLGNVTLHQSGLGAQDAELPFYSIEKSNFGLGTCSHVEQYDLPLKEIGKVHVARGDDYLEAQAIGSIDAIKIDVQGFEPEVLLGLHGRLTTDRPIVWFELGGGTLTKLGSFRELQALFPYPVRFKKFETTRNLVKYRVELKDVLEGMLTWGDYVAVPEE
jgi:FkbM family methyltransferase